MASVDVVIPVLNEEHSLPWCLDTLKMFLTEQLAEHDWRILVVDNGSTDGTLNVARQYAEEDPIRVACIHLDQRGRGRALRKAWLDSDRDVLSYMDVDLSTGLEAFPGLVKAITEEGYHVATGSRLARDSRVTRSFKREAVSRIYNFIIKAAFFTRFSDAQCGFKAVSREAADVLVPVIVNNHWFFDTELLIIAEKRGFRVKDIPVTWKEDPDTRVKVVGTAIEDLKGLARLRFKGIPQVSLPFP